MTESKILAKVDWEWHHLAMMFMALYYSEPSYLAYKYKSGSPFPNSRRTAVMARANAVVQFDRVICGEKERWMVPA